MYEEQEQDRVNAGLAGWLCLVCMTTVGGGDGPPPSSTVVLEPGRLSGAPSRRTQQQPSLSTVYRRRLRPLPRHQRRLAAQVHTAIDLARLAFGRSPTDINSNVGVGVGVRSDPSIVQASLLLSLSLTHHPTPQTGEVHRQPDCRLSLLHLVSVLYRRSTAVTVPASCWCRVGGARWLPTLTPMLPFSLLSADLSGAHRPLEGRRPLCLLAYNR